MNIPEKEILFNRYIAGKMRKEELTAYAGQIDQSASIDTDFAKPQTMNRIRWSVCSVVDWQNHQPCPLYSAD
jgi:hypothetical protein